MRSFKRLKGLIFSILVSVVIAKFLLLEPAISKAQPITQPATELSSQDKVENAPEQTGSKQPSNWAEHALVSYSLWCQGNIFQAMNEGEKATELNPASTVSLINLALMKQNSNGYSEAILLYKRACDLEQKNWVPPLGIARCYIMSGNLAKGRKALRTMSEQTGCNFDWYYMAAKTWLGISDLNMAEKCASKAIGQTSNQQQKAAAENLLFLVLLRENKLDQAKSLQDSVFQNNQPREPELYVRAALEFLAVNDQTKGKTLLDCALANFNTEKDADAIFKLGRVFEIKAADPKCDTASHATWLENAQTFYTRAITLNPKSADYHFALAGIYSSKRSWINAAEELKKALSLDRYDILAPFLIAKILSSVTAEPEHAIPLNLSLVQFKIEGITCACKLSRIQVALRSFKNVVFISTPPQKPFAGLILVDQSQMPAKEVLSQCGQKAFPPEPQPKAARPTVKLEMISEEPVTTVDTALKIATDVRFAQVLDFQQTFSEFSNRFKEIHPIMPVNASSTTASAQGASSWSAPL